MVTEDARKGMVKTCSEKYTRDPYDRKISKIRKVSLSNMTTLVRRRFAAAHNPSVTRGCRTSTKCPTKDVLVLTPKKIVMRELTEPGLTSVDDGVQRGR